MLQSSFHASATLAGHSQATGATPPRLLARSSSRTHWTARFERCVVHTACREVLVDGQAQALQPRAFDLLTYLIENRHRVVPADELLDQVWCTEEVQLGSLAAAVMRVRRALCEGSSGRGSMIRTYAKFGYRFVAPATIDFEGEEQVAEMGA
jgi:DNA-binding winged helix-turn-helix (wHTH) protein